MDEREQRIKALQEQIEALPEAMQKAIFWMIGNMDVVDQLAEGEPLTDDEVKQYTQKAIEKEDYCLLALVLYKQSKDRIEKASNQQEN